MIKNRSGVNSGYRRREEKESRKRAFEKAYQIEKRQERYAGVKLLFRSKHKDKKDKKSKKSKKHKHEHGIDREDRRRDGTSATTVFCSCQLDLCLLEQTFLRVANLGPTSWCENTSAFHNLYNIAERDTGDSSGKSKSK